MVTVAEQLVDVLVQSGVRRIYGVVGDSLNPLVDAIRRSKGALITVAQHDLNVKAVVFNNTSLGMVRPEMMVDGLPAYETDHAPVDYSAVARGVGISSWRVEKPTDVHDALSDALSRPGPALVEIVTDPNALSVPSHIALDQVTGFALAAGRTVLDGGVGTMIDLARANWSG